MNKEPKDAVIITHSGDPDGIVSAAFIADILESKYVSYELRFADYPNLIEVMETASRENGKSLYILDLGLSQTELPDEIMMPLLENNDVHYFDHHEIEVKRRNLLEEKCKTLVSKNKELCTAKLIVEHHKLEGTEHEVLSDCAQTTDYYGSKGRELTELGTELAKAISPESGLSWENIVQTIREGLQDHKIWRNGYNLTGELAEGAAMTQRAMNAAMPQFEDSASCHELFIGTDSTVVAAIAMSDSRLNRKRSGSHLKY